MSTPTIDAPDVELTEFEVIEVDKISGVAQGANGFPHLMLKGIAVKDAAALAADDAAAGEPADAPRPMAGDGEGEPAHQPLTGSHMHEHQAHGEADGNNDGLHLHMHAHSNDSDHGHDHAAGTPADAETGPGMGKAVVNGKIDQKPDISLGQKILTLLGQAMGNESDEVSAGKHDEVSDVHLLAQAADLVHCWLGHEKNPDADHGMVAQSVLDAITEDWAYPADDVVKAHRVFTAEQRRTQASSGHALPDGSYPMPDADAVRRAAILIRSKKGKWKAAAALLARRVRALGIPNPLSESTSSKSVVAEGTAAVQDDTQGTDDLAKAIDAAVTKALESHKAEIATLRDELAKVKALPRPGGPVMSSAAAQLTAPRIDSELAAKAELMRAKADVATDPADAQTYRQLARQAELEMKATTT